MRIQDIPRILFDEFREGEAIVVERRGIKHFLAPLKCDGDLGIIGWYSCQFSEGEKSYLLIFIKPKPPSENTLDNDELVRLSCGLFQPLSGGLLLKDTIYLHPISDRWWLEYPLASAVIKILARAVELLHSPECEKRSYN